MRIGVLGGTFDPPHAGHLAIAQAAKEQLELDEVVFMPAHRNPLKSKGGNTPAKQRLEMVRRLVAGKEGLAYSDLEITRGGPSFTVDTMTELQMASPADYWFILGADSLKGLPDWKQPERLLKLTRLAVAVRPPTTESDVLARLSKDVRERVDVIKMKPLEISATEIRNRLSSNKGVGAWVAPEVLQYIRENNLYRS
jgi:nicotinate-nucleotide adenylyltransferase